MADETIKNESGGVGNFFSPEAFVILPLAIILDLIGIILVCFALDDFWITDIIGFAIIGSWSFLRSRAKNAESRVQISDIRKRQERIKKIKQTKKTGRMAKWGKRLKFLEFIPYVGAIPFWTISVYFDLKES